MKRLLFAVGLCLLTMEADARVLSYAPYSPQPAVPAVQQRGGRYFAMLEYTHAERTVDPHYHRSQLVLYDSRGEQAPRVVFPFDRTPSERIVFAAMREREQGLPSMLVHTFSVRNGLPEFYFTNNGVDWQRIAALPQMSLNLPELWHARTIHDSGGPIVRGQFSLVQLGTAATPFVVSFGQRGVWGIDANGRARLLAPEHYLLGTSLKGDRIAVWSDYYHAPVRVIDIATGRGKIAAVIANASALTGWVAPDGTPMLHDGGSRFIVGGKTIATLDGFQRMTVAPTADYRGAWIAHVHRAATALSLYTLERGLELMWIEPRGREIEALHAARSGRSVLIQVHRPRPLPDQRLFVDPALAIWRMGDPPPPAYDELYMNESDTKGFVHLDVDRVAAGAPFVFDAGVRIERVSSGGLVISAPPPMPPAPVIPVAGGADVVQEWGFARSSLRQSLVLSGIGGTAGASGNRWRSDVTLHNPANFPQEVTLRFAANGAPADGPLPVATLTLEAGEIRLVRDVLQTMFALDEGSGALVVQPEVAIAATARTYATTGDGGTYGFQMNAVDANTAFGPRFPASFAAAICGPSYRTDLALTNVSAAPTGVTLRALIPGPSIAERKTSTTVPIAGQTMVLNLSDELDARGAESGSLTVASEQGFVIPALFVHDRQTDDVTHFPPDIASATVRTIAAIGRLDNGKYTTDVHLFNPTSSSATVQMQWKRWDSAETRFTRYDLLPNETQVVRDAGGVYGGVWRVRFESTTGVRVTVRAYTKTPGGGTYGFAMVPLNNFQLAAPGDSLEVLGATTDARFRTNITLVDTEPVNRFTSHDVRIEIFGSGGRRIDSFTARVPSAGGIDVRDIFRERNLQTDTAVPVLIRISPDSGVLGAYVTMTDAFTSDPVYLPANLGAKLN